MATTVTGTAQVEIYNVTLAASAGNVTEIRLPARSGVLMLTARTNDSKLCASASLADGGAIGAVAYQTLPAGTPIVVDVSGISSDYIYLGSATNSAVVELLWSAL